MGVGCGSPPEAVAATQQQQSIKALPTICGEEDPLDDTAIEAVDIEGDNVTMVTNLTRADLHVGIWWGALSEKNELQGVIDLGELGPDESLPWRDSIRSLGIDLSEHLGAGELMMKSCIITSWGCTSRSPVTQLYFVAADGRLEIGRGRVPMSAGSAGAQLAAEAGLVDREDGGDSNLTVRVVKQSSSTDWQPDTKQHGPGEER